VVFEIPGEIALKAPSGEGDKIKISVCFDPVKLNNTRSLTRIDLSDSDQQGSNRKTTERNITIEVEVWRKNISTGKVLAQIDD